MAGYAFGSVQIEEFAGAVVVSVTGPVGPGSLVDAQECIRRHYVPEFNMPTDCDLFVLPTQRATGTTLEGRRVLAKCLHFAWPDECTVPGCRHFAG